MTYNKLVFLIFIFLLGSCNTVNNLNYSLKSITSKYQYKTSKYQYNCISNPQNCNNTELCEEATLSGQWQTKSNYIQFVQEAQNRGLSCGVRKSSRNNNTSDNQTISNRNDCTSNASKCTNTQLCKKATLNNEWEIRSYFKDHVSLAKQKGLDCGVSQNSSSENNKISSTCYTNPKKCSDELLCKEATRDNKWDERPLFKDYVNEAKFRGLTCGIIVNQGKNNIDNMMKYALRRLVQLNILSSYQIKNKEQIIQNMSSTRFKNLYQLCKNAFANSEPMKCDYAIKGLN